MEGGCLLVLRETALRARFAALERGRSPMSESLKWGGVFFEGWARLPSCPLPCLGLILVGSVFGACLVVRLGGVVVPFMKKKTRGVLG